MRPIVLGTDGSPSVAKATDLAIELARATGVPLYVVAAWQTPVTIYASAPMVAASDLDAAEIERATEAARAAVDLARRKGVETKRFVRNGEPLEMISRTATNCDASLVMVGSHGWGPVRRLVSGSVSKGLLHHAPVPCSLRGPIANRLKPATSKPQEVSWGRAGLSGSLPPS
jgi:nucleotide-binding universal stress UspA family protein